MSNFKKFLALVLATLMVASVMVFTAPAASAATDNHADDIAFLGAIDVFKGYGADNLGADDNILRYQMALFIARIDTGITDDSFWQNGASAYFTDCNEHTFPGAIDYCYKKGYINGKGDGIFDPWGQINYQEALTMLVRLLGREKKTDVFPIDQYITASKLGLTANIDGTLTKALKRNEIADLVVKTINKDVLDAEGKSEGKLIETVLGAKNIGTATLVATWNASVEGYEFAKYGEYKFTYAGATDPVVVTSEKLTKGDLDVNNYLGFTADLVSMTVKDKIVYLATMHDVTVAEANVTAKNEITINGKKFANTAVEVYGSDVKHVFVDNTADIAKGTNGKVVVCDTDKNGVDEGDIVRFIPYNDVRAIYPQTVSVTKADNAWKATEEITVYYVAKYDSTNKRVTADVLPAGATKGSSAHELAKMYGLGDSGLSGTLHAGGISNDGGKVDTDVRTTISKDGYNRRDTTSYNISVIGDIVYGDPMVCSIVKIGGTDDGALTFVTCGKNIDIESGRGVITEMNASQIKIGDTYLPAGFTLANKKMTGTKYAKLEAYDEDWYFNFDEAEAVVTTKGKELLGKEVNYTKVDGKIVALKEYKEATTTPTPEKTYLTDPFTATPLFVSIKKDAKLTVAEDGTIAIDVLDPNTLTTSTVKFDQINGKKIGALVNQFGYAVAKGILGVTADDLTGAVKELLTTTGNVFDYTATKAKNALYLVTVANKADDVYALSTTNNDDIKHVVLGTGVVAADAKKVIVDEQDGSAKLGFVTYTGSSLSDKPLYVGTFWTKTEKTDTAKAQYSFASKYLTVTKDTVINVIAKDGVKSFTDLTPGGEDFLNIVDNGLVLALSNDLVIIVNNNLKIEEIAKFGGAVVAPTEVNGGWYTLTWTTQYVSTTAETVNGTTYFNYTFKDLYNLTTNAKETVVISSTKYYSNEAWETSPAKAFFGATWINTKDPAAPMIDVKDNAQVLQKDVMKDDGKTVKDAKGTRPDGADYTTYDVYFISNERGTEAQASSIYSWGLANGYLVGKITSLIHKDANTFVVENVKLVPEEGVGYTVNFEKGDDTKDYKSVVSWSAFYLNQSTGSSTDEMTSMEYNTGNSGIPGKIIANSNNSYKVGETTVKPAELILYKVGTDGVATIYTNLADNYTSADATIADTQAK